MPYKPPRAGKSHLEPSFHEVTKKTVINNKPGRNKLLIYSLFIYLSYSRYLIKNYADARRLETIKFNLNE